jgi:hypothetical protein
VKGLKALLVVGLLAVVGMAFRVSWNALRDIAAATGADPGAANLYPFVVDGLLVVALVAALVLTGKERKFALRVLGAYTAASLALNYVHGMVPGLHRPTGMVRLADWGPAHWALVLLATSLPVGAIYFGSDLVAKVLHHHPAPAVPEPADSPAVRAERVPGDAPAVPAASEVYPELPPPVPEPVPPGVRVLPIVPRQAPAEVPTAPEQPEPKTPVLAAETPRTREVVHAEYVPEATEDRWETPGNPAPPSGAEAVEDGPQEDPLTGQVRRRHAELLTAGRTPSIRQLRAYGIGQDRAKRIQDELKRTPA